MEHKGITLIGMSEAGKTTLGPILAQKLGWSLYDVDEILVREHGKLIGEIVDEHGQDYLLGLEVKCVMSLELYKSILVTPGSIVYDTACHQRLKDRTTVVWLDVSLDILKTRYGRDSRKAMAVIGVEDGFTTLFQERRPLYECFSDVRIKPDKLNADELAEMVLERLSL